MLMWPMRWPRLFGVVCAANESIETRFYIASLAPDPQAVLAAVRTHWGIEKNLHWTMDVTFDEDRCRSRKDDPPSEFRVIQHAGFNTLKLMPPAAPATQASQSLRGPAIPNPSLRRLTI